MTAPQQTGTGSTAQRFEQLDWHQALQRYGRTVAIGAGVVVVGAAAVWLYVSSQQRKERFASQELMQARSAAESGNLPLAASDLARLTERFGGTRAADEAVVLLNQIRLIQGQRDVAVNALREFVRTGRSDEVKAAAYGLLGGGLEDQGKLAEAAAAYQSASAAARLDFQKAQYLLDAGRAFAAAGDTAAAKGAYGEVLAKYGESDQAAEARVRLAEVGGSAPPQASKRE